MTGKNMMRIGNRHKVYLRIVHQESVGSFIDFTLFCMGYFRTKNKGAGYRAYVYLTICNYRLCVGIIEKEQ